MLAIGLAAALAAAAPAAAVPVPPVSSGSVSSASVTRETAAALARTVAPIDTMGPLEIEQARKAILTLPTIDANAKELETQFPGIWAAVWAASEPEVRRSVDADTPKFWAALEQMYLARLTQSEAEAVLTFYRSASGQKLLHSMAENFDAAPLLADVVKSDNGKVSAERFSDATHAAQAAAAKSAGPEDLADLMALLHAVNLEKFKQIGEETRKITLDWVNKEDPDGEARLEKVMQEAMKQYIAKHPARK